MSDFEVLEHTADVGLLARGSTLSEVFASAARGMAEIAGAWGSGVGQSLEVIVEANDVEALLVEWLGEVLYLYESKDAALTGVRVGEVTDERATGEIELAPFAGDPSEGVQIKAVTFHQLAVRREDEGWTARVFFDI